MKIELMPIPDSPAKAELNAILPHLPELNLFSGPWLAGGAVRRLFLGEQLSGGDLDFFFENHTDCEHMKSMLKKKAPSVFATNHASSYDIEIGSATYKLQAISRKFYRNLKYMFEDFDFTVTHFACDGNHIACTPSALRDIESKNLVVVNNQTLSKQTALHRLVKYTSYGYIPEAGLVKKVLATAASASKYQVRQLDSNYGMTLPEREAEEEDILKKVFLDWGR